MPEKNRMTQPAMKPTIKPLTLSNHGSRNMLAVMYLKQPRAYPPLKIRFAHVFSRTALVGCEWVFPMQMHGYWIQANKTV
jgi:hypothetical protein